MGSCKVTEAIQLLTAVKAFQLAAIADEEGHNSGAVMPEGSLKGGAWQMAFKAECML